MPRSVTSPASPSESELVTELLELVGHLHHQLAAVADAHGLTVQQLLMLRSLNHARSMRDIAAEMCCDPSNVTGMIDRLEARGLVERTPGEDDRRVKMLSLTAEGRSLHRRLETDLMRRLLPREIDPRTAMELLRQVRQWASPALPATARRAEGKGG
jgi:DNA-binding MarR family transcriptional regulator